MTLLDDALPRYDFVERHAIEVDAPPERALAAAKEVTLRELPLVRSLFALRSLPALLVRGRGLPSARDRPLAEQMIEFGFVALAESDDEIVLGFLGQPWRLVGGSMPSVGPAEWRAFDAPGYAKAAANFHAAGGRLTTETRVLLTDPASRRAFRRYWLVIRPFSGLIRRAWLHAAKRRGEASPGPKPPSS